MVFFYELLHIDEGKASSSFFHSEKTNLFSSFSGELLFSFHQS